MATNSKIGILNNDGSVTSVYCHWDGYVEGVGYTLLYHYDTEEKVRELLSYGDISILGEVIGSKHSLETPNNKGTIFYGRDFNYNDSETVTEPTLEDAIISFNESTQEYFYLFDKGKWKYTKDGVNFKTLYKSYEDLSDIEKRNLLSMFFIDYKKLNFVDCISITSYVGMNREELGTGILGLQNLNTTIISDKDIFSDYSIIYLGNDIVNICINSLIPRLTKKLRNIQLLVEDIKVVYEYEHIVIKFKLKESMDILNLNEKYYKSIDKNYNINCVFSSQPTNEFIEFLKSKNYII